MGFPEDELTNDESVVLHIHPHWKALVGPLALLVVVVAALVVAWVFALNGILMVILGVIGLALVIWLTVIPYMKWHSTHYVFTNERVLTRVGLFSRDLESVPLNRVNDISSHQSFLDRLFGCGSITIESAGDRSADTFKEIPHVSAVVRQLHELIDVPSGDTPAPRRSNDGDTKQIDANN